jgi:hypothetical protein
MPVLVKVRPSSGERGAASCYWCAGKAAKGSSIEVTASLKTQVTKLEKLLASEQDRSECLQQEKDENANTS